MTWALVTAAWVMLFPTADACFSKMRQIDAGECRPIVRGSK